MLAATAIAIAAPKPVPTVIDGVAEALMRQAQWEPEIGRRRKVTETRWAYCVVKSNLVNVRNSDGSLDVGKTEKNFEELAALYLESPREAVNKVVAILTQSLSSFRHPYYELTQLAHEALYVVSIAGANKCESSH